MFKQLRQRLARKLYPEIFEKNYRMEMTFNQYLRWLSEMPDVTLTIENMKRDINGQSLSLMFPPSNEGPWELSRLREHLRAMRKDAKLVPEYPAFIP